METATTVCSVALYEDSRLLAHSHLFIERLASSKLTVMTDELLKRCNLSPKNIHGVAVSSGPGSYTGLRIGAATAKGLCYTLNIPLIAVSTLEALTEQMIKEVSSDTLLCPLIDARKMEVFCSMSDSKGNILLPAHAKTIEKESFSSWLKRGRVLFFGNGAEKCMPIIQHPNAVFLLNRTPSAVHVGVIALEQFNKKKFEDLVQFEPHYLKDFVTQTRL